SVGVVNGLGLRDGLVLDVGGGSAEVSQVVGGRFRRGGTAALGAVRLTEMFLAGSGRAKPRAVAALEDHVAEALEAFGGMALAPGGIFVGIGGTVRALARIDREARGYAFPLLNGYELKRSRLRDLVDQIAALPVDERPRRIPALPVDRADIILAGALTVLGALRWATADRLTVCGHGLREGLFFAEFLRPAAPVVRRLREFSVFNLGRLCGFEPIHASHVTRLALSLYDQLRDRHGYGEFERGCLWAAGQLHDIGTIVEYYDHHKHSAYIILNAGLPGYSHRETAWIALLCLYHRKGQPALENLRLPAQAGDRLRANRLAALLRLAEYLDRSRTQSITRLRVTAAGGRRVRLRALVRAGADGQVEIWEAQRNAGLFEQAFDCRLEIEAQ
ncbi:MAG: Ppx/GppA family phosphatase, partial [Anaerolineales bacterium]|nr:Ppx/GppA family phosphatase [Anaerolineales bacterium]